MLCVNILIFVQTALITFSETNAKEIKVKKKLLLFLVVLMIVSQFSAFGSGAQESEGKVTQKIVANTHDSESWDPLRDSTIGTLTSHIFETLVIWEDGKLVPGAAKSIELSDDGLVYTITLKDNLKWSDGKPLSAEAFKYGMLRTLDPASAGKYAKDVFYIKNGEAFNAGEVGADEVGIKVISDTVLELTLEGPCGFFESVLTNKGYAPLRKDIVESDPNWWMKPETMIGSGAFMMKEFEQGYKMVLVPNPNYWNADEVKLDTLEFRFIADSQVELLAFKSNEIQVGIAPPSDLVQELIASGDLYVYPKLQVYWLVMNNQMSPMDDVRIRRALALSIDREAIVNNVLRGGQVPAFGMCPPIVNDVSAGKPFRDVYPEYFQMDVPKAKKLLAEAGYPDGKGFPPTTYLLSIGGDHAVIAQAIQSMWKQNLGIEVELEALEIAVFIKERRARNYPIARYVWTSNRPDPSIWLQLYTTDEPNNDSDYRNPEYDRIIDAAARETDVDKRFAYLHQAEKMLIDDMAVIPLFYPMNKILLKENLKSLTFTPAGGVLFNKAYVE